LLKTPKIVIAGTHSSVGKTSISLCIMSAFKNMGLKVQPFKIGPDYIDPSYHTVATGFSSHNLDVWMTGANEVCSLYEQNTLNKDIAIIEGVMGLFDGFASTNDQGSTAQIAKLLNAPVILVVDAGKMARSVSAIIKGYQALDPQINLCGVILNRVASVHHLNILKESIEHYNAIPVLGSLKKDESIAIPERHLGLKTSSENNELQQCLAQLIKHTTTSDEVLKINLNEILNCAKQNAKDIKPFKYEIKKLIKIMDVRIAYARDKAFQFYYQANLDYLESLGATLVPFSPLNDNQMPQDIDGLYFGGGFPEVYAKELESNARMRQSIQNSIQDGIPTYAECGGLIYLAEAIKTIEGNRYQMVGVIPGTIEMTHKLQNFGYCENTFVNDCLIGKQGEQFRGHEFHYSSWSHEGERAALQVEKKRRKTTRLEGFSKNNLFATYVHCHFLSNKKIAERFLLQSLKYSDSKKENKKENIYAN